MFQQDATVRQTRVIYLVGSRKKNRLCVTAKINSHARTKLFLALSSEKLAGLLIAADANKIIARPVVVIYLAF